MARVRSTGAGVAGRAPVPTSVTPNLSAGSPAGSRLERGWTGRLTTGRLFDRWAAIVGEEVAEHARPIELKDAELTVQADSTAWATQLRLLQRQLIAKIAAARRKRRGQTAEGARPDRAELALRTTARARTRPPRHLRVTPGGGSGAEGVKSAK